MSDRITPFPGWYGACAILIAYALLSLGYLHPKDLAYLLLNLTGSAGLVWQAYQKRDTPLVVLNVAWVGIAILGLARYLGA